MITLPVGRKRSVALVESLSTGRRHRRGDPARSQGGRPRARAICYDIGTFVRVADVARLPGGEYRLSLEGLNRFTVADVSVDGAFWLAEGTPLAEQARRNAKRRACSPTRCASTCKSSPPTAAARWDRSRSPRPSRASSPIRWPRRSASAPRKSSSVLARDRRAVAAAARGSALVRSQGALRGQAEDRRRRPARARQGPARGAPARAAESDPSRARRRTRTTAISPRCKKRLDEAGLSEEARTVADRELGRLAALEPATGRVQRHPHLPRVDRRSAVERQGRRQGRPRRGRRRSSTRTTSASTT